MKYVDIDVISRDGTINYRLESWLRKYGMQANIVRSPYGLVVGRNLSVETFLADPEQRNYLIQFDDDLVPDADTEAILTAPGELVYCGAIGSTGHGHFGDGDFGVACCRLSRRLLTSITPPWFDFVLNASKTRVLKDECLYFRDRARMLGYESKMVGRCSHITLVQVKPDENGKPKFCL